MKNIFIDCGTNFGQGLDKISKIENIDFEKWDVYSFEANPLMFENIKKHKNVRYFNVGVSDFYGFSNFHCENNNGSSFDGGGSTLLDLKNWKTENVYGFKPEYYQVLIPVIDLCDFIKKINPPEKGIILKLDVEGSEYQILNKIKNEELFKYIKKAYIEFHDHITNIKPEYNSLYWIGVLQQNGVEVIQWT